VPIAEAELWHTTLSIKISGIVISSGYSKLFPPAATLVEGLPPGKSAPRAV
jgi:hypothetical protein